MTGGLGKERDWRRGDEKAGTHTHTHLVVHTAVCDVKIPSSLIPLSSSFVPRVPYLSLPFSLPNMIFKQKHSSLSLTPPTHPRLVHSDKTFHFGGTSCLSSLVMMLDPCSFSYYYYPSLMKRQTNERTTATWTEETKPQIYIRKNFLFSSLLSRLGINSSSNNNCDDSSNNNNLTSFLSL